ncbi:DUF551 domain-containing protein [Achromobacter xylosoxidans]|uniref:hypothetical protein n=1 Tax=Alcaligenes xylosoxydans xylosoxydans TaxID=85698 RepID=UPI00292E1399|nr:hypothetical protein [Achromobacter xylosoxidans]WOB75890.1 hypothetical protein PZA07_10625 [Achromobacter xylosoxidans]
MTNFYDVANGLSQDEPGPLEPVEIAQQDDTLARTGNTARDQEMYAAGIRTGEENAKHNAAIRAGAGWLPIESAPKDSFIFDGLHHYGTKIIVFDGSINTARWWRIEGDSASNFIDEGGRAIYPTHWMPLPAAPGVSTVEDTGAHKVVIDFDQVGSAGPFHVIDGRVTIPAVTVMDLVRMAAPAAGDALDAARWRWLCDKFGITKLPCAIERIIEGTYVADGKEGIDAAIDAAIAAQRKGDA